MNVVATFPVDTLARSLPPENEPASITYDVGAVAPCTALAAEAGAFQASVTVDPDTELVKLTGRVRWRQRRHIREGIRQRAGLRVRVGHRDADEPGSMRTGSRRQRRRAYHSHARCGDSADRHRRPGDEIRAGDRLRRAAAG